MAWIVEEGSLKEDGKEEKRGGFLSTHLLREVDRKGEFSPHSTGVRG